jgi:hypothetical protein
MNDSARFLLWLRSLLVQALNLVLKEVVHASSSEVRIKVCFVDANSPAHAMAR